MNLYTEIMNKANNIFIESTSGPKAKPQEKLKESSKSLKKKAMKKTLVSPFRKIYDTGKEIGKLKIKQKGKSTVKTTEKRNFGRREQNRKEEETIKVENNEIDDIQPNHLKFSTVKKGNSLKILKIIAKEDK